MNFWLVSCTLFLCPSFADWRVASSPRKVGNEAICSMSCWCLYVKDLNPRVHVTHNQPSSFFGRHSSSYRISHPVTDSGPHREAFDAMRPTCQQASWRAFVVFWILRGLHVTFIAEDSLSRHPSSVISHVVFVTAVGKDGRCCHADFSFDRKVTSGAHRCFFFLLHCLIRDDS